MCKIYILSFLLLSIEKYHAQMKEAQQIVSEKTSALEAEAYKNNRLQVHVRLPTMCMYFSIKNEIFKFFLCTYRKK